VERVDPAAYTKVSALGIEEQRVDATLYPTDTRETWKALGHEFRIVAHISVWSGDVVRVPLAAIFRRGQDWTVYRVVDGAAVATPVTLDHRNASFAEVTAGLAPDDTVVLHPSDKVTEGTRVVARE
jgi:HlyD family secretion protein